MCTMEEKILIGVKQRQEEFKAKIETMTLKKCRKLLEQDMGLEPGGLDDYKDHVRDLIEKMVVNPGPEPKAASKASNKSGEAQKQKASKKQRTQTAEQELDAKQPGAKEYGTKVQRLKRVCKAATIAIPPSVYTRVTSEQDVITRLKELLSRHGLARDSSAEEIARVKRNLKKERDLDGIDTENILDSSRSRRARTVQSAYVASPSDEDESLMGDENEQPGNGESYSGESSGEPENDGRMESGNVSGGNHASQDKADVVSAAAKQSTHKEAGAPGRAPKRLADWSESDEG